MSDYQQKLFTPFDKLTEKQKDAVANFLFHHLDQYGDKIKDIKACLGYAMKENDADGGYVITVSDDKEITGTVVVNKTGMKGYIPENILVYIAVHKNHRGKGIGKLLMQSAIKFADGDVALHVEPDNPARFLYEKLGFTHKYLEMRYSRK